MLSLQGLRKPSYHAHQLLRRLGSQAVPVAAEGDTGLSGGIVTDDGRLKILAYNYLHDDQSFSVAAEVQVKLPENVKKNYDTSAITAFTISASENNILTLWNEMGSPEYIRTEELDRLKKKNSLTPAVRKPVLSSDGAYLQFTMDTPSVMYIEIPQKG
jgi:xylan 1,4-beta-xylosidase